MKTVKIINKETFATNTAVYAADSKGNMRYNVDGKFYTDKAFDKKYAIMPTDTPFAWKSHVRKLFEEILGNNESTWILNQPLRITLGIFGEIAKYAAEIKDEKLIGYCSRLSLYEFSDQTHENYSEDATNYFISKSIN